MAKVNDQEIFIAARAVLDAKGFEKARLADVARKLGISPAALYKHFSNKEDLFSSIVEVWVEKMDKPALDKAVRMPENERITFLHDWLLEFMTARRVAFTEDPQMLVYYEKLLADGSDLLTQRVQKFASAVEHIMAWDTFKQQRGMTIMFALTYFYHPFFADKWDDTLFQTLFESTWLELLPIISQDLEIQEH
ncbi:MAG: TetR/AcrR family transcriptional regulator [Lactobacillaceae bacterium]|nr:TetR/AcrR family transcriptional regulator [Lactobacillaceae bacterium]